MNEHRNNSATLMYRLVFEMSVMRQLKVLYLVAFFEICVPVHQIKYRPAKHTVTQRELLALNLPKGLHA